MPKAWQVASTVAVSINDEPLGAFALADDLKADTPQAITALQESGLHVILMSGDKQSSLIMSQGSSVSNKHTVK